MKKKELMVLAKKIAKAELVLQNSNDKKEQRQAEEEIMRLSSHVNSLEDITIVDEIVQEILKKS